jgi:predicted kinase
MAALTKFDSIESALREMSHLDHREVGWSMLWNLATAQLGAGCSVVLDGVAREVEAAATREVANREGALCFVVTTSCGDLDVHRRRVEGRSRGIPDWYDLTWDHVANVLDCWEAPTEVDLHLDAVADLEDNATRLFTLLERS